MSKNYFSKSFVANTVTSLNIFSGFISLVYASQNDFKTASIFIIIAAIFDTLDGIVARLLDTSSQFGVELRRHHSWSIKLMPISSDYGESWEAH